MCGSLWLGAPFSAAALKICRAIRGVGHDGHIFGEVCGRYYPLCVVVLGAAVAGALAQGVCVDLLHLVPFAHRKQFARLLALASNLLGNGRGENNEISLEFHRHLDISINLTYILWRTGKQEVIPLAIGQLFSLRQVRHRVLFTPAMHNLLCHVGPDIRPHAPRESEIFAFRQTMDWFTHFILPGFVHNGMTIVATHHRRTAANFVFRERVAVVVTLLSGHRGSVIVDNIVQVMVLLGRGHLFLSKQPSAVCGKVIGILVEYNIGRVVG